MAGEAAFGVCVVAGTASALLVGFAAPPLTESRSFAVRQSDVSTGWQRELNFCRANLNGVSCQCFATKSSQIADRKVVRVEGYAYPDQRSLARRQAALRC